MGKFTTKKSWTDKVRASKPISVFQLDKKFSDVPEGATLLIASPAVVDAAVREIPRGTCLSTKELRAKLAEAHNAEFSCPVTTGIFLRIAAEAAWEQYSAGASLEEITPFWRVVDAKAPMAKKLACGLEFIQTQRKAEGLAG
jgi:hypothetical protein